VGDGAGVGDGGPVEVVCMARALSVGSQWLQSSKPRLQGLLDQQAAKPGAVDEQVAFDPLFRTP
jgi:hypothetical protein